MFKDLRRSAHLKPETDIHISESQIKIRSGLKKKRRKYLHWYSITKWPFLIRVGKHLLN